MIRGRFASLFSSLTATHSVLFLLRHLFAFSDCPSFLQFHDNVSFTFSFTKVAGRLQSRVSKYFSKKEVPFGVGAATFF